MKKPHPLLCRTVDSFLEDVSDLEGTSTSKVAEVAARCGARARRFCHPLARCSF